jgi:hypothetical protein
MLEIGFILPLYLIADTGVKISHVNVPKSARVLVMLCSFDLLTHSSFFCLFKNSEYDYCMHNLPFGLLQNTKINT